MGNSEKAVEAGRRARLTCELETTVTWHTFVQVGEPFRLEELLSGSREAFRLSEPPRWGRGLLFRCEACGALRRWGYV